MYEIPPTAAMQRWSVSVDGFRAIFACAPWLEDPTADRVLPRLWPGRGLGVSDADTAGLAAAVAETMKAPSYWTASHRGGRSWQEQPWSVARRDHDEGFVYFAGPCGEPEPTAGYRPAYHLPLALRDLRGLRIRLAAYLRAARVPG
ncbi:hypothetical protein [Amycolatopsis benzoatilytica]|uniref:hypothetical protein n=1 Tax=Amycolatopsis benzoatilytica TaxID=346045 RepID=UPI00039F5DC0|nr:hypothetical protein [Amycolatopsis benzoatilytica]